MNKVRVYREKQGLTLRELSRRSKVSLSNLWSIEKEGRSPSIPVGQRIAGALGVPLDELFPPDAGDESGVTKEVAV